MNLVTRVLQIFQSNPQSFPYSEQARLVDEAQNPTIKAKTACLALFAMGLVDANGAEIEAGGGSSSSSGAINVIADIATLQAMATVGINNKAYLVADGDNLRVWWLHSGTDPEDIPNGTAHPTDYNASTNAKIFSQAL